MRIKRKAGGRRVVEGWKVELEVRVEEREREYVCLIEIKSSCECPEKGLKLG